MESEEFFFLFDLERLLFVWEGEQDREFLVKELRGELSCLLEFSFFYFLKFQYGSDIYFLFQGEGFGVFL